MGTEGKKIDSETQEKETLEEYLKRNDHLLRGRKVEAADNKGRVFLKLITGDHLLIYLTYYALKYGKEIFAASSGKIYSMTPEKAREFFGLDRKNVLIQFSEASGKDEDFKKYFSSIEDESETK